MEVVLKSRKQRVKKPIVRDHYWYDPKTKQRLHGRGGEMIFVYDSRNKKMVPRIIDAEEWVWEDSYKDILEWIDQNDVTVIDKVRGYHITIDVDTNQWTDLEENLYRHKIVYDYDALQLKKEAGDKKSWQNSPSKWPIHLYH